MLLAPLYKKFKNVSNPQNFFRKSFIAASVTGVMAAYGASGAIVYNIAQSEWNKKEEFGISNLLSLNLVREYGLKGGLAAGLTYVGDAAILYSVAGFAYWRTRRSKDEKADKKATTYPPLWGRDGAPPP